jgi:hypothetical protein
MKGRITMKNRHKLLSIMLVIVLITLCVVPAFNADSNESINPEDKISDTLKQIMNSSDENELIPIYIWYKDINQKEVDQLTTQRTGLTPEKCNLTPKLSLNDNEIIDERNSNILSNYISSTISLRAQEKERCDLYQHTHRVIANEKYIEKSNTIKDLLSINDDSVAFTSKYAPMIIIRAYRDDIERYTQFNEIEEISYYDEKPIFEEPIDRDDPQINYEFEHNRVAKENMGLDKVYDRLDLTGSGINIGLVEAFVPGEPENGNVDFDIDRINVVEAPNHPITPGRDIPDDVHWHANNSANVIIGDTLGVAKNANIYATTCQYDQVEALLSCSVNIVIINNLTLVYDRKYHDIHDIDSEYWTNPNFAYTDQDKYYDHLVSYHHVTTVVATGNQNPTYDWFDETWHPGARVGAPGMGSNVITVGSFLTQFTPSHSDDLLKDFKWKNHFDNQYGVEKPDVIVSSNFAKGGGTSTSSPALAATIALLLELKPSLSFYPEALKAITLASCHRKVNQNNLGNQETIENGITERQGAGVPDAWIMTCIVCQGTYGVGEIGGFNKRFFIEQPPYDSSMMNLSLTWIKENHHNENIQVALDETDLTIGRDSNLSLTIYQNNQIIASSDLQHSSTEMCYFELNSQNYLYGIEIKQNDTPDTVRYGYAWSTNQMKNYTGYSEDGIYFLRNRVNDRYITESTNQNDLHLTAKLVQFNQNNISDLNKWIVRQTEYGYTFDTCYGSVDKYLSVSDDYSNNGYYSETDTFPRPFIRSDNGDGTFIITTADSSMVLSYKSGKPIWIPYSTHNPPTINEKWYFDKVNYLKGDANTDGTIDIIDASYASYIISNSISENNIQRFLADCNNNGSVDLDDVYLIQRMVLDLP